MVTDFLLLLSTLAVTFTAAAAAADDVVVVVQEHDVTEKVLHAMLSLATSCRSQFRAAGHSLAVLVDK